MALSSQFAHVLRRLRGEMAFLDGVGVGELQIVASVAWYRFLRRCHCRYRIDWGWRGVTPASPLDLATARGLPDLSEGFRPCPNERANASPATAPFALVSFFTRLRSAGFSPRTAAMYWPWILRAWIILGVAVAPR